jgi:hypothetical protein
MATLSRQNLVEAGITVTESNAAGGGDKATNIDGKTLFLVNNGSGGSIDVTVTEQMSSNPVDPNYGNLTKSNVVKSVAAGAIAVIGPFPPAAFNDANGDVNIGYSSPTTVTVAALRMP